MADDTTTYNNNREQQLQQQVQVQARQELSVTSSLSGGGGSTTEYAVTLIAKWGKEKIELNDLSPTTNIAQVKDMLSEKTNVLPKRQKLIGLTTLTKVKVTDQVLLSELKPKSKAMTAKNISGWYCN